MSELPQPIAKSEKHSSRYWLWLVPLVAIVLVVGLALVYYGGGFFLTRHVDNLYEDRDCAGLVKSADLVESYYPVKAAPFATTISPKAAECRAFLRGETMYEQRKWKAAYNAYVEYKRVYPKGIYVKESVDLAADALYNLTLEQRSAKEYPDAVNYLMVILQQYGQTPAARDAQTALPETYLDWGEECRADGEFSEAETVYLAMDSWAEKTSDGPVENTAHSELAQTYFDWGRSLQAERNFAEAADKFEQAVSVDPDSEYAAQVRDHLPGFHAAWAQNLMSQGKYSSAIAQWEASIRLSPADQKAAAQDQLSQAYLDWAEALEKRGEYAEALGKIKIAIEKAGTDKYKDRADGAYAGTMNSFANSKGSEAQAVIAEVEKSICKSGVVPQTLPIVGISDRMRMTVYGVNFSLPFSLLAETPADMHYVACVETRDVEVQSCPYSSTGYGVVKYWIKRIRYEWTIKIFDAQTGSLFKENKFTGGTPESCPARHTFSTSQTTHYHYGELPSAGKVTEWFESIIK